MPVAHVNLDSVVSRLKEQNELKPPPWVWLGVQGSEHSASTDFERQLKLIPIAQLRPHVANSPWVQGVPRRMAPLI